ELVYREIWHDGTGDPRIEVVDRATPQASQHEPVQHGEPVAAAHPGPVRARIDRLHRSYLCHLTDGTHSTAAFLPAAHNPSIGTEAALARELADARLPARYAVVRHPWR